MRNFRDIKVWAKSHELTLLIYQASRAFPREEIYSLTNQIRRAAASIPTNIAEGSARGSHGDFARFAQIALGSASEVEYLLLLARDLQYVDAPTHENLELRVVEIKRMLTAFVRKLRADSSAET
jgi:four helix bundle protein